MDAIRKSAILLLTLEKALAAEVLSQMSRDMVEKVTLQIAKLNDVTREEQEQVLNEFYDGLKELTPIERGSLDFAGDLLRQSLGEEGASSILDTVKQSMSSLPFGFLQKVGAENILTFISDEHPQTISLILSHVPAITGAEVLRGLSPEKQIDVCRRIANMEQTSPEVVLDVEKSLEARMNTTINQQLEKAGGIPMIAEILNVTDRMTNKAILEKLDEEDSELADEIRRLMFVFEDILKLDDKAIQSLLKEVDNSQWSTALKGASDEIKKKIFGNLSQRAAEMLKEEMSYLGPIRVSEVEEKQQAIVDIVRRLEEQGVITVSTSGDKDAFI
jgi:flagellar motor switch protein FliG